MDNIIVKIVEWPAIVQGALGSALFWLILVGGQKFFAKIKGVSREKQLDLLTAEWLRYKCLADEEIDHALFSTVFIVSIYSAFNYVLKGIIVATMGLLFSLFVSPLFAAIGLVMALYYFFYAINFIRDSDSRVDAKQKANELYNKIQELGSEEKESPPSVEV